MPWMSEMQAWQQPSFQRSALIQALDVLLWTVVEDIEYQPWHVGPIPYMDAEDYQKVDPCIDRSIRNEGMPSSPSHY